MRYFGCNDCPQALADADPDGDGVSNMKEFLAGTDPTDPGSPAVREYLAAIKLKYYDQLNDGAPALSIPGFGFYTHVLPGVSNTISSVTDQVPGSALKTLTPSPGSNVFSFSEFFVSQTALDGTYTNGLYTLNIGTVGHGSFTPALNLPTAAYPNVPQILNYNAAQTIDASTDFFVSWTNFVEATTNDFISFEVDDIHGSLIFQTPTIGLPGHLTGTTNSVRIPSGTLASGSNYTGRLTFVKLTTLDTNTIPLAVGITGYAIQTSFGLRTAAVGLWSAATDLDGGWKHLDWFGDFVVFGDWIWHSEHGWLYCVGTNTSNIWLWSSRLSWVWTSDTVYPFVWWNTGSAWLWYVKGSGNTSGGWFYNYATGQFEWK